MVEYVLSDKNGRYIRKDNGTNKYVTIRGERYAMRFPEYSKAANVLKNCVAKTIRSTFSVVEVVTGDDTLTPTPTKEEVIKSIVEKNIVNDDIRGWLEKVEAITSLTESMDVRAEELSTLQSNVEKEIVDIQHYIEFGNLNAYQGWLATSMLQNRLRQRRKYKDELMAIHLIKTCKIDANAIENLHSAIDGLSNRKYAPRMLPGLFTEKS